MISRRLSVAVATLMAMVMVGAGQVSADVVDQEAPAPTAGNSAWLGDGQTVAQPFTAGMDGTLTSVTVEISRFDPSVLNSNLTVAIYPMGADGPTGTSLTAETIDPSAVAAMPGDRVLNSLSVSFSSPISVSQGDTYAIVVSSTDAYPAYHWFQSEYSQNTYYGNYRGDLTGANWNRWNPVAFATYVGAGGASSRSGGSSRANEVAPSGDEGASLSTELFPVILHIQSGEEDADLVAEVSRGWIALPSPDVQARSSSTFLGWATSEDFPIDVARDQVSRGWGTFDQVMEGERMIFIPAGGSVYVVAPTRLFAIYG